MSAALFEVFKALLTGGTAAMVFVIGQAVLRFVIEPAVEMRRLVAQIGHDLVFYRNCFSSPGSVPDEEWEKATSTYRRHASSLRSLPLTVPFYDQLAPWLHLPTRICSDNAAKALIGISNTPRAPKDYDFTFKNERFTTVHQELGIPTLD